MMEPTQSQILDSTALQDKKAVHFPEGLPAFEMVKEFVLISNEEEAPFLWLQASAVPDLAFITIDPFLICPSYRPDICDEDVRLLKILKEEDVFILSVVNINQKPEDGITTNLVSPIVINGEEQLGKQVILQNHRDYSVKYRIDSLGEIQQ